MGRGEVQSPPDVCLIAQIPKATPTTMSGESSEKKDDLEVALRDVVLHSVVGLKDLVLAKDVPGHLKIRTYAWSA